MGARGYTKASLANFGAENEKRAMQLARDGVPYNVIAELCGTYATHEITQTAYAEYKKELQQLLLEHARAGNTTVLLRLAQSAKILDNESTQNTQINIGDSAIEALKNALNINVLAVEQEAAIRRADNQRAIDRKRALTVDNSLDEQAQDDKDFDYYLRKTEQLEP